MFVKSQPCRNPLGPSCFDGNFYRRPPIKFYIISTAEWSATVPAHIRLYRLLLDSGWTECVGSAKVEPLDDQRDSLPCWPGVAKGTYTSLQVHASVPETTVHMCTGTGTGFYVLPCDTGVGKACWGPPRIFAPPAQLSSIATTLTLRGIVPLPFSISTIFPLIDNP